VIHAVWNLLLAGARDSQAATAVALVVATLAGAPAAAATWRVDRDVWPYLVASAALEIVYFALLATAYSRSELSVVYPLARGLAPVFVLIGTVAVTSASTSAPEAGGVCLVAAGVLLVRGLGHARAEGALFGIAIAICIASYTVVDKHGIAHASPMAYNELVTIGLTLAYVGWFALARGTRPMRAEIGPHTIVGGCATFAAYSLVLFALRLAPAPSVAAVRETSVLVATALAAVFLRERVTLVRLAGAVFVVGGVALLSL
jgi:drug/metabolite transporter (DMT)-like permease